MRRPLVALTVLSCLGLVACEDGPTQTYSAAPPGAGSKQNDGQTPPVVDPGMQGFTQQSGGNNAMQICTGSQEAAKWATMVTLPIQPRDSSGAASTSPAGTDSWTGLTIEQAEQINCQSVSAGDQFGDGSAVNYWGDNGEVSVDYNVAHPPHRSDFLTFWPGYPGAIDHRPSRRLGAHVHHPDLPRRSPRTASNGWGRSRLAVDGPTRTSLPRRDQRALRRGDRDVRAWRASDHRTVSAAAAPASRATFGDVACTFLWGRAILRAVAIWSTARIRAAAHAEHHPCASTCSRRQDIALLAREPPPQARPPIAPSASPGTSASTRTPCQCWRWASPFTQFLKDCGVEVTGNAQQDTVEYNNKLVGGISRTTTERFEFDVQGIDLNFSDPIAPRRRASSTTAISSHRQRRRDGVHRVDQSTLGKMANDFPNNDPLANPVKADLHGSGLVYLEYARLVQATLNLCGYARPATTPISSAIRRA